MWVLVPLSFLSLYWLHPGCPRGACSMSEGTSKPSRQEGCQAVKLFHPGLLTTPPRPVELHTSEFLSPLKSPVTRDNGTALAGQI